MEDSKELMETPEESLTEDDRMIKKEQKKFMNSMYKEQFPDIVEIILIYTYRKQYKDFQDLVQAIDNYMLRLVLEIMKDKNDFDNIFKKLKNESRSTKNTGGVT